MQCVHCQLHFPEDRDYFVHLSSEEHEVNADSQLDPEEESLLNKYN
jgi:hypothetical protein